jgi:ADP-dependent NAD(P)H-hydrate dehydratase / NAD(P)H-hydrate epimerase
MSAFSAPAGQASAAPVMSSRPLRATPGLYDVAGLRALEARAIGVLGGDGFELMRRAGRAAWRQALRHWPQAQRVVVVCGPGNNGGDGYAFARYALDSGRDVRLLHLPRHAPRSGLAQRAAADCAARGVRPAAFAGGLPAADLVVDALFGIGLDRAPDAAAADLIAAINAHSAPVLALDVPSGLDADRGSAPGAAVRAARTIEFVAAKAGLRTGPALDLAGALELAPLDVEETAFDAVAPVAELLAATGLPQWLPARPRDAHKGMFGRVLCIGGELGHGGAIALCAEAALRCGAGLVEVATREAHVGMLLARRPEAMVVAVERATGIQAPLERADVVAIGPGLGQQPWGRVLFAAALASGKPLVLDADALNLLARGPRALAPGSILTPHPGEAARLLESDTATVQADRFGTVRALCDRYGAIVVLKGAGTLVAAPGERIRVIEAGNPGMASGGMGDLLTGMVAGLRAQGLTGYEAASAGALLHALAGDRAAAEGGARGLLATDLLPWLRRLANPPLP